jgi:hypothetical protein
VWIALELQYKDGVRTKGQWPPLVGELRSESVKGVHVLRLLDLNQSKTGPLATLWKPELVGAGSSHLRISGMEVKGDGDRRRWFAQQWYCEVLTHQRAMTYFDKRMITGELPSAHN